MLSDTPIQRKLLTVILLICSIVLLLTCVAYFAFEYVTYKQNALKQISVVGKIIAANNTANLAFDDKEAASEIMLSLKAEPHIVIACLYDKRGRIFASYPADASAAKFPRIPTYSGYKFSRSYLEGFEPVIQRNEKLGTLYLQSDMKAMQDQFALYGLLAFSIFFVSFIIAWLLTMQLQRGITDPILSLVKTAKAISGERDYSVRAKKFGNDELGSLTDALNHMLSQIESQNREITTFNQQLEQKVDERTSELESANRELESFSYSVSHDLRAPLRRITMFIQLFTDRLGINLDSESTKLLGSIKKNSVKMAQLIDDLLAFARVGKSEMVKTNISMNSIVRNICQETTRNEEKRTIDFQVDELPDIYADSSTITQVWENLISNAVKFTRNNATAIIKIGADKNADEIIYHISDNGSGFDMKAYRKLFTAFQRLHSTSQFDGTGIGLAIVERVVTKHGGKIWAEGTEGAGATFYFSLPINPDDNVTTGSAQAISATNA